MDLHWYLRSLEEVIIRALSAAFAVKACRLEGLTGVWVGKLAAWKRGGSPPVNGGCPVLPVLPVLGEQKPPPFLSGASSLRLFFMPGGRRDEEQEETDSKNFHVAGNQKIAAIGIRVSRWLTYHGLALNVSTDLAPFADIVPCGIRDRDVGSLRRLLGPPPAGAEESDDVLLMDAAHAAILREFCEVFQLSLEPAAAAAEVGLAGAPPLGQEVGLLRRRN